MHKRTVTNFAENPQTGYIIVNKYTYYNIHLAIEKHTHSRHIVIIILLVHEV